jgi:dTDP-4-amino-4,6-dideoxygalactose transaminase
MPSWTFVATAHAARAAGLTPYFVDVDPSTWAVEPEAVLDAVACAPDTVGAIVIVSPFGAPLDIDAWARVRETTGLPVVIDAAAGFDGLDAGSIPTVVSLHATKSLSAGEGGFLVCTDPGLVREARARSNFGFDGERVARGGAINAKLSEYGAAVGLANLARWPERRQRLVDAAEAYALGLDSIGGVARQSGFGNRWVGSTINILLPEGTTVIDVAARLRAEGVDTRRWWEDGCDRQPAFADCPRRPLPATRALAQRTLGLPFYPDLKFADITRVVAALNGAVEDMAETGQGPAGARTTC